MAHLLLIESWVRSVGLILPEKLRALGHRFTLVSRKPEHYSNWARGAGLLAQGDHPVVGLAEDVIVADTNDVSALIDTLRPLQRERGFDGVLTTCDYYLDTTARVADALGLPGPSPLAMEVTRHKHLMREACRRADLPGPHFRAVERVEDAMDFAAAVGYPVVVKAVDLCAGEQVSAVHDAAELGAAFRRIRDHARNIRGQARLPVVLVEELLRGVELSVETCSFGGETSIIGITDKSLAGYPHFIESGLMHPADIDGEHEALLGDFVRRALTAVGYTHGLAHTELKLTAAGPRIIEINARMGGSYLFELVELVTGIDLFAANIALALDRQPDMHARPTGIQSAAIRFLLPPRGGRIDAIHNAEEVRHAPGIHRLAIDDVIGQVVREPEDNNDFIGHVIAIDRNGRTARARAEWAFERLDIAMS